MSNYENTNTDRQGGNYGDDSLSGGYGTSDRVDRSDRMGGDQYSSSATHGGMGGDSYDSAEKENFGLSTHAKTDDYGSSGRGMDGDGYGSSATHGSTGGDSYGSSEKENFGLSTYAKTDSYGSSERGMGGDGHGSSEHVRGDDYGSSGRVLGGDEYGSAGRTQGGAYGVSANSYLFLTLSRPSLSAHKRQVSGKKPQAQKTLPERLHGNVRLQVVWSVPAFYLLIFPRTTLIVSQATGPNSDEGNLGTHRHETYGGHNPRESDNEYGSGTVGGVGFGNKTNPSSSSYDNSATRFGKDDSDPYSNSTDYGSGTTSGVGYGNKNNRGGDGIDSSDTRFDNQSGDPYSDSTRYGSGTTSGAGFGNKTKGGDSASSDKKVTPATTDSTIGKLMEKAGGMMKNEGMVEKGRAKREEKGAFEGGNGGGY
ncbi:hypothetical protein LTR66_007171 [Elasticomyces elasticus]|nr:hypothetical protein LTR66_007171 [Elasticomyces elasticus]